MQGRGGTLAGPAGVSVRPRELNAAAAAAAALQRRAGVSGVVVGVVVLRRAAVVVVRRRLGGLGAARQLRRPLLLTARIGRKRRGAE